MEKLLFKDNEEQSKNEPQENGQKEEPGNDNNNNNDNIDNNQNLSTTLNNSLSNTESSDNIEFCKIKTQKRLTWDPCSSQTSSWKKYPAATGLNRNITAPDAVHPVFFSNTMVSGRAPSIAIIAVGMLTTKKKPGTICIKESEQMPCPVPVRNHRGFLLPVRSGISPLIPRNRI